MAPASSIEDILTQLGVQIVSISSNEIACNCPFHPDKHPSFSMNLHQKIDREGRLIPPGVWVCYQCGQAGSLSMLIERIGEAGINPTEILREIRYKALGRAKRDEETTVAEQIAVDPFVLFAQYDSFKRPPRWALEERMFDRNEAARFGIKWDRGWVIPIWAPEEEQLWGWQFKQLKFVSNYPNEVKKSRTLFGLRALKESTVALVESPLDVVRLAAVNVPAVASYGAFVSNAQIQLLVDVAEEVILALDNDEEGQRQQDKVFRRLSKFVPVRKLDYPKGVKDPGDLDDEQAVKVFV